MKLKKLFILCLFTSLVTFTYSQATGTPSGATFPDASKVKETKLSYKIISAPNNTFGYDIYSEAKLLIHQPTIPAMPGNEGFSSKSQAIAIAELVLIKIKKGEMPPTVSKEEMKKLKVIK